MFGSLVLLLLSSAATAGPLPSGSASGHALFHAFVERGVFGPISTGSAAGIAGGQIACDSPPVSSFFAGLKPPVCETWGLSLLGTLAETAGVVPNQLVVGPFCGPSWHWHGRGPVPVPVSPRRLRRPVRHQHQPAVGWDLDQAADADRLACVLYRALGNI